MIMDKYMLWFEDYPKSLPRTISAFSIVLGPVWTIFYGLKDKYIIEAIRSDIISRIIRLEPEE